MRLLLLIAACAAAWGQPNPVTRVATSAGAPDSGACTSHTIGVLVAVNTATSPDTIYDCREKDGSPTWVVRGYSAPGGYSAEVTSQTTLTVTADTHGQGLQPIATCLDDAEPANQVDCQVTVDLSTGEVVFTWSPAFSGTVLIRGPGAAAEEEESEGTEVSVSGPFLTVAGTRYLTGSMYPVTSPTALTWTDPQSTGGTFSTPSWGSAHRLEVAPGSGATVVHRIFSKGSATSWEFAVSALGGPNSGDTGGMRYGFIFGASSNQNFQFVEIIMPDDTHASQKDHPHIQGSCYNDAASFASNWTSQVTPLYGVGTIQYFRFVESGGTITVYQSSTGAADTWQQIIPAWNVTQCMGGASIDQVGIAGRNAHASASGLTIMIYSVKAGT